MLPEKSYFGQASRKSLEIAGIVPKIICECTLSETVRNLMDEQIGIALLPDFLMPKHAIEAASGRIPSYNVTSSRKLSFMRDMMST